MTISRQQEIKATLYVMLLQKREENAITLAATANNGRIIEEPLADERPVAPKRMVFMLAALILGLAIPVGIVYLHDLLKYKIENREDVEAITGVAILAELPLPGVRPLRDIAGRGQGFRRWQLGGELGLLGQEGGGGRHGHPQAGPEQGVQYLP